MLSLLSSFRSGIVYFSSDGLDAFVYLWIPCPLSVFFAHSVLINKIIFSIKTVFHVLAHYWMEVFIYNGELREYFNLFFSLPILTSQHLVIKKWQLWTCFWMNNAYLSLPWKALFFKHLMEFSPLFQLLVLEYWIYLLRMKTKYFLTDICSLLQMFWL